MKVSQISIGIILFFFWTLLLPASLQALTVDEIIRLREAGVDDLTIRKLINQECDGGVGVKDIRSESGRERTYFSVTTPEDERNAREEKEKMERALEMLRGITIEQRRR